jgi:hypothetical protein
MPFTAASVLSGVSKATTSDMDACGMGDKSSLRQDARLITDNNRTVILNFALMF